MSRKNSQKILFKKNTTDDKIRYQTLSLDPVSFQGQQEPQG